MFQEMVITKNRGCRSQGVVEVGPIGFGFFGIVRVRQELAVRRAQRFKVVDHLARSIETIRVAVKERKAHRVAMPERSKGGKDQSMALFPVWDLVMGQYEAGKFTIQAWWESDEGRVSHDGLCS